MIVLVLGGTGMLGHKLVQILGREFELWTTLRGSLTEYENFQIFSKRNTIEQFDVRETKRLEVLMETVRPNVIINAIGIIKQLPDSKDIINTLAVNSIFPHQIAEFSKSAGAYLINISTDCVFSGKKGNYTEEETPDAPDLYGKSKNLGEVIAENCLTIRTSIIGRELKTRHSLVEWFLSNEGEKVRGFLNAVFSGFPTIVLAGIIKNLIEEENRLEGLYHVSSLPINKFDLLSLIKEKFKVNIDIEPYEDFRIDRSLNSEKFRKATGFAPTDWEQMIEEMAVDAAQCGFYSK